MGAPQHGKAHVWILVLLVWVVALSLVTIGLLVTRGKNAADAEELAVACQNGTTNAVNSSLDRLADACASAEPGKSGSDEESTEDDVLFHSYNGANGNNMLPTLSYPYGWSATLYDGTNPEFVAQPSYFFDCEGCGGFDTSSRLFITTKPVAEADEMDTAKIQANFVEASKTEDYEATNITVSAKALTNGTAVYIDGHEVVQAAGGGDYDFHEIRFKTSNTYVKVVFVDTSENLDEEWELIKNSLDFSKVK